jgi:Ca-activated chloride channel family protein
MHIKAQLDVDVVALEGDDEVTCLVALEAPTPADLDQRPGETLVVVVDRSGSMARGPLRSVRAALHGLVDRLKPQDSFGVVQFDSEADIAIPTRPMRDHDVQALHAAISRIRSRGMTDLSAGYLLGLREAAAHPGSTGASLLLLSDGHANEGITEPDLLGDLALRARKDRVTTGTIGIGDGYDEKALVAIASAGGGTHRFAFTADDAQATLAEEAGDILTKSVINAFLRIRPHDPSLISRIGTILDVRGWSESDAEGRPVLVLPLGDFYAGERREVLIRFEIPSMGALGLSELATFTLEYVALPELASQVITWPIAVNVVPGDEAARRIANPTVTTARLIAESTKVKRNASEAIRRGETQEATALMSEQAQRLRDAKAAVPDEAEDAETLKQRLELEAEQSEKLARSAMLREARQSIKSFDEDRYTGDFGRNDWDRMLRRRQARDW